MNEIMTALEAMIRRVVKEEIERAANVPVNATVEAFANNMKLFADREPAMFAAVVSQGALDHPWFDNAVKVEVDAATESLGAFKDGFAFPDKATFESCVADATENSSRVSSVIADAVQFAMQETHFKLTVV